MSIHTAVPARRPLASPALLLPALLACGAFAAAADISRTIAFDPRDLRVSRLDGYDRVTLGDCVSTFAPGEPQMPIATVFLVLPPGSEVDRVVVTGVRSRSVLPDLVVRPAQQPQILSALRPDLRPRAFTPPNPSIYGAAAAYPPEIVTHTGTASCGGWRIAGFAVHPLQYLPLARSCLFHEEIGFTVTCREAKLSGRAVPRRPAPALAESLRRLVSNPEDLDDFAPTAKPAMRDGETRIEYLIVTHDDFAAAFRPLADWKTRKGVPAEIFTTSWIYANYTGADNQARIRAFLRFAFENWGTAWVLLGGDTARVPCRKAFALDCMAGIDADENNIPCDLYYADLDGTWNAGGSPTVYGEVADEVDLLPDLFVGRAPASTVAHAQTFVSKVLAYEKNPPPDYLLRMLFAAEILWTDPFTDQGVSKDAIDEELVPDRFAITKLYARDGTESRATVLSALNKGMHIFNHDGHAWYTVMQVGSGSLTISDMDGLANGPEQTILYSIGCWQAAFDRDAIAEHFINNPNGGGVANIGNSRYGWGAMGEPGFGYSDRYDREFYRMVFERGERRLGEAVALSKATFAPLAREANVYRWCQYQINLLGDPEMPIRTDAPGRLDVAHPPSVPAGTVTFPVTVTREGAPVADALVCVMQEGDVYATGRTDPSGRLALAIAPESPVGPLLVTATAADCLPSETTAEVVVDVAYVAEAGAAIDDGEGNGDGLLTPGETVRLGIALRNFGSVDTTGVAARLEPASAGIAVTAADAAYGDIPAGATVESADRFTLTAGGDLVDGETVYLRLVVSDAGAHTWEGLIALRAATPVLACRLLGVDDGAAGDGDGVPEPGEGVELLLAIENKGLAPARMVAYGAACADAYLTTEPASIEVGLLAPGEERVTAVPAAIDAACPVPRLIAVSVALSALGGYAAEESVEFIAGATGFGDDVEGGAAGWTLPGTGNLWHVTSHRSRSGSQSWYCGVEGSWTYTRYNQSILVSSAFDLCLDPVLSFWAWYDVALYGTTGMYVEVSPDGVEWEKLDFIGSGGALDPLLMGNGWMEYTYDLSRHAPATPLQVRFRFVSDGESVYEGVYIDDIAVGSAGGAVAVGFVRGDANGDGAVDIADAIHTLGHLFAAGPEPGCRDAADANDDGRLDLSDTICVLLHLFGGRTFDPPLGACGADATADGLDCLVRRACP